MSKEPLSIRHVSLEEEYQDLLKTESCNIAPEIFWDEVQDSKRKTELDSTLCKEGHLSEPLSEDFIYDFEDASETLMSSLNTLRMCSMNEEPSFSTNSTGWKEYNEELLSQAKLAQQGRVLGQPQESSRMGEDSNTKDSCELLTEVETPPKEFVVKRSDAPVQEDPFLIMGEPLLDCIVKESPIKEVSSFLTQPTGSLFQTNECSAGKDLLIQWDGSSAVEKTLRHEGTMMISEQHNESAKEAGLTVFPDALDENLDYIRTLIQSNRCLKEHLKSTLAHCINKEKVTECTSASPSAALVSKGDHNAEEKSLPIHSTKLLWTADECWQGDTGDKGIILPYTTKSCSLTPYEVSHKLCHGNSAEFTSKQLLLQEGDMDFNRVIKDLEEDHQKQLSRIVNLQYGNIFFEKKMKEIEKALLQEGVMDLNKALQGLQQDQKMQQTQIMDLYYDNVSLRRKIKELEVDFLKNCNFLNTIKELKGIIMNLTEAKNQVIEENNEAERQLKGKKDMLANKEDPLQDSESEKVTLMLQLEKLHADYSSLQAKYQAEVEQKNQYMNQCTELNCALHKKEQEMKELSCVQQQLEHEVSCTTSALHKLRQEKDIAEKHLMSLQAEFQKQKSERQAEKEELSCRYNQLVAQIKTLQTEFENERVEMENMQKQVCAFQTKNSELQQQIAKDKEQNHFLMLEPTWWKEECDWIDRIRESQTVKDMKSMHSDLSIRSLHSDEDHFSSPYVHKASHLLSKIRSLLALTEGLLTCQTDPTQETINETYAHPWLLS
ncbi:cancer-associated gene 1 protein isoform X2 [Varanus komodoensis]|uniref:cancer-associated gene 1 protein isoform X2 n=1 Tax=Varanus komodoensis TaxID=61221 RepID=UPI001CF7EC9D|nr:cancer-associated gene 1 protein isoform X2 [Varanus komodoensis]